MAYVPTMRELGAWFDKGKKQESDYMIIATDQYEWADYPIYVSEEEFNKQFQLLRQSPMQTIMEIYNLNMDRNSQLREQRTWNIPQTERNDETKETD
jgi:hypothetical protein